MVRREVKTEREVESEEGIFEDFGEIVALTIVFEQIIGRFVVQTCGQAVEGQVEVDVVAQRYEHAELKFGQIESVVESNADSAVKFGACKFDLNAVDIEKSEDLFKEVGSKDDFESVIAEFESVYDACHESENRVDVHTAVFFGFLRNESLTARRIVARAEHIDKFSDVEFNLFYAYAKDVRFEIYPTVLQINRKHFFVVGLLGNRDLCGRFQKQIEDCARIETAGEVDVGVDVEFKTAVDVAQFDQRFEQNALEHRADFLVGHIDFDICEFAFEGFDVEGKSRGHVDVKQIGVQRAVFENGKICAFVLSKFVFEFFKRCLEVGQIVDFTKGNVNAERKTDEGREAVFGVCFVIFANAEFRAQSEVLVLLRAVVDVFEQCAGDGNVRTRVVARKHKREYRFENISGQIHAYISDVEDVFVHTDVDMVENHTYKRQDVDGTFAFRRRVRAVLNDDFAVVDERLLNVLSCCAAFKSVYCAFDGFKNFVDKVAQKLVDVDVVDFELRSAVTEQAARVDIYAFFFAGVVSRHAFCAVTTENFGCKSCLFCVLSVDVCLKFYREFHLAAGKIYFFCKQRFECFEHFGVEILSEKI